MREAGWRRSGLTFSRWTDLGDAVLVNVQVSSGNEADRALFFVNVLASPLPYRRFLSFLFPGSVNVDRPGLIMVCTSYA